MDNGCQISYYVQKPRSSSYFLLPAAASAIFQRFVSIHYKMVDYIPPTRSPPLAIGVGLESTKRYQTPAIWSKIKHYRALHISKSSLR